MRRHPDPIFRHHSYMDLTIVSLNVQFGAVRLPTRASEYSRLPIFQPNADGCVGRAIPGYLGDSARGSVDQFSGAPTASMSSSSI